jgi:hypothetical protein
MNIHLKKNNWNFIINGAARSGKDTFIKLFEDLLNQKNSDYKIISVSSVDYIKSIARLYFDWDDKKDEKGRQLLSDLKDATTKYNNLSFFKVLESVNNFNDTHNNSISFIHWREPEEIDKLKDQLKNSHSILIRRNNKEIYMNHADQNVENYNYDFIFDNNKSIDAFRYKILSFIETNILK